MFEGNSQVENIYTMYVNLVEEIETLDESVEPSASGRKVLNSLVKDSVTQTDIRGISAKIYNDNDVVSAQVWLNQMKSFKALVDVFIKANSTESTSEISDEERALYETKRDHAAGVAKGLRSVLELSVSEDELNGIPSIPRKPTMGVKRGKRIKGYFTYTINGEDVGHLLNKELSAQLNLQKQSSLSEALDSAGFDPSNLPDFWQVTIGSKVVTAERIEAPSDAEVEVDEDEDLL